MKQIFLAATFLLLLSGPQAAPSESTRPKGVTDESWVPVSTTVGFVISDEAQPQVGARTPRAVTGYFVAYRNGEWVRLEPVNNARVYRR